MYVVPPPRGPDGAAGAADEDAPRVYQAWKGSNDISLRRDPMVARLILLYLAVFFLQGRFVFGPDVRSLFLTIFLVVAPIAVFCVFVARKLMDHFSRHWGISIMVIAVAFTVYDLALLLLTSGRDPGIIPRNTHPPEPEGYDGNTENGGGQTPPLCLPRVKDVIVNGVTVKIKYCDTCMLYRPPRCSHCSICNNCVQRFDHHCPWVGQCIGLRNYRFYFMFVFSTTLLCIYVFGFCWVYIKKIMDAEHITIWRAMTKTPASIVLLIYTFISMWFVGLLSIFHLYLISSNQTKYESFRYRYDRRANPYNRGVVENFKEIFFSNIPPSKNKFRARMPLEQDLPVRPVGGFISPDMGKAAGDIEESRKPVAWEEAGVSIGDPEEGLHNEMPEDTGGKIGDSSDFERAMSLEGFEGQAAEHPRRSS